MTKIKNDLKNNKYYILDKARRFTDVIVIYSEHPKIPSVVKMYGIVQYKATTVEKSISIANVVVDILSKNKVYIKWSWLHKMKSYQILNCSKLKNWIKRS